jgi:hypothetical protein
MFRGVNLRCRKDHAFDSSVNDGIAEIRIEMAEREFCASAVDEPDCADWK